MTIFPILGKLTHMFIVLLLKNCLFSKYGAQLSRCNECLNGGWEVKRVYKMRLRKCKVYKLSSISFLGNALCPQPQCSTPRDRISSWKYRSLEIWSKGAHQKLCCVLSEAIWTAISKLLSASQQQKVAGEIVNIVNFFISILNGEIHSRGGGLKVHWLLNWIAASSAFIPPWTQTVTLSNETNKRTFLHCKPLTRSKNDDTN